MPARLIGLWGAEAHPGPAPDVGAPRAFRPTLARFPAEAPWARSIIETATGGAAVDRCGDSPAADTLASSGEDGAARIVVAGTIRLDGATALARGHEEAPRPNGAAASIAAAYRRFGERAFAQLEGAFAFALWDEREESLFLVRDPFGARRLHFASSRGTVAFSTEVEGVLAWPGTERALDDVTILDFLLGRYETRVRTFFRAVRRVEPGTFVRFRAGREDVIRYAAPPEAPIHLPTLADYAALFRERFEAAVAARLPPSGPVVCHLSGGLDSSSVACVAAARLDRAGRRDDLTLVTARFPGLACDEGAMAARTAAFAGARVVEWDGTAPEVSDLHTPRLAWPIGRSSIGASRQGDLDVAERLGSSTLLSGLGGNQVTDDHDYMADAWREDGMPGVARATAAGLRGRGWRWRRRYLGRVVRYARADFLPPLARAARSRDDDPIFQTRPAWLGTRLQQAWAELRDETPLPPRRAPATGSWMSDATWEAATADPRHVWSLEHEDARATERGMEFRYPFLSWPLLALSLSVPWRMRAPRPYGRALHREAMKGLIPEELRRGVPAAVFNQANARNFRGALPPATRVLAGARGAVGDFVSRPHLERALAIEASRPRAHPDAIAYRASVGAEPAAGGDDDDSDDTNTDRERRRLLRDLAALEAWLTRFSC